MSPNSIGQLHQDLAVRRSGSAGSALAVTHYAPDGHQERHEHDHAQVSFLVAGAVQETIGRTCHEVTAPSVCIKPAGADHENLWGSNGALLVSARLPEWRTEMAPAFPVASWVPCRAKGLGCAIAAGLLGQRAADIDEAIADLLALLGPESSTAREPPGWVRMVAEAVRDCDYLTAEDAARLAGVHRVHLSRAFAKHFGVPFSAYRKRVMIGRAIERAVRSAEPLAKIAHASGFADQSHMHRDLASLVGLTPRQFRAAFRAAASPR